MWRILVAVSACPCIICIASNVAWSWLLEKMSICILHASLDTVVVAVSRFKLLASTAHCMPVLAESAVLEHVGKRPNPRKSVRPL